MKEKLSKKERVLLTIRGEETDRMPVSFWRHFYAEETDKEKLAEIMLAYQKEMGWDFMKINARASYHDEPWGTEYRFYKDGFRKPEKIKYPVKSIEDYKKIVTLNPLKNPVLRDHLDCVHYISKGLRGDLFFLMTLFTPISIIGEFVENFDILKNHIKNHPDIIHKALENVTATFEKFTEELLNAGISGLFYATRHWASYDYFTKKEFDEFCRPYDLRILKLVEDCPLNMLHICKSNNMLEHLGDYPVQTFHWDSCDKTNPYLDEGLELVNGKVVVGGVDYKKTLLKGNIKDCIKEAKNAFSATGGKKWFLGSGCTYYPETPVENLKALKEWAISCY